jgi:VanZ family protein
VSVLTRIKYWLPALVWGSVIFWFSSRPAVQTSAVDWQDFLVKKAAHFVEYYLLAVLIYRSLASTTNYSKLKLVIIAFFLASAYAISDEIHQSFIPGREPRLRDVFIDSAGIVVALRYQL